MNDSSKTTSAVPRKAWYGLRALFELASREDSAPVKVQEIAARQQIPVRFLETILCELRQAGIVSSQQGQNGGYMLAKAADAISVAEILRLLNGLPSYPSPVARDCSVNGDRAFAGLWREVETTTRPISEAATLAALVERERQEADVYDYVI